MAPLFAISTYFGWVSDDASLILRAVRLFVILALAGLGFLFAGHHLKVAEIAGLRGFATSLLNRRKR
jgi:putative peptidoglycan lipid II flippase